MGGTGILFWSGTGFTDALFGFVGGRGLSMFNLSENVRLNESFFAQYSLVPFTNPMIMRMYDVCNAKQMLTRANYSTSGAVITGVFSRILTQSCTNAQQTFSDEEGGSCALTACANFPECVANLSTKCTAYKALSSISIIGFLVHVAAMFAVGYGLYTICSEQDAEWNMTDFDPGKDDYDKMNKKLQRILGKGPKGDSQAPESKKTYNSDKEVRDLYSSKKSKALSAVAKKGEKKPESLFEAVREARGQTCCALFSACFAIVVMQIAFIGIALILLNTGDLGLPPLEFGWHIITVYIGDFLICASWLISWRRLYVVERLAKMDE